MIHVAYEHGALADGREFRVRLPNAGIQMRVLRLFKDEHPEFREIKKLQMVVEVKTSSGVFRCMNDNEFDEFSEQDNFIVMQATAKLRSTKEQQLAVAQAFMTLLPSDAPPEVFGYLKKLTTEEQNPNE